MRLPCIIFLLLSGCADPASRNTIQSAETQRPLDEPREGLEVIWWMTDDSENQVGQSLAPFLDPPQPTDAPLRERWRATGLRLIRVPLDQLPTIQTELPSAAQRYRQPLGWTADWLEVFRGRRIGETTLMIAGAPRTLPPGVVRIIARCWPVPPSTSAATIHLDLAFQFEPTTNPKPADPFAEPTIVKAEDRGEALRELTLAAAIEPGFAYILTCETPDTIWKAHPSTSNEDTGFSPPETDEPQPASPPKHVGPIIPSPITLGEAAMQTESTDESPRRYKAVIALVVRGKQAFRLLP